jgi:hypothetical protein
VAGSLRIAWIVQAALVMMASSAYSQVRIGELSTNLRGTVSTGYSADYGNLTSSDHSWVVGGSADYSGSFYNPNFVTFDVSAYLNQSLANSNYQSISNARGVNLSSNIFGGSHFP